MPRVDSHLFSISDQPEESKFVPLYDVPSVVYDDNEENAEKTKQVKMSKNACWNCGDKTHNLRQCTLPINHEEIRKNRQSFSSYNEFKRYHIETMGDKFLHLKPGVISDNLREALGLRGNQLPEHIYRMRSLGYPPGWLLEAKSDPSGIEMFDADGNRVPNADEEEGEIGNANSLYNEDKIITYPGFNAWPTKGTLDETRHYHAPEMDCLPSKEDFIKQLKENSLSSKVLNKSNRTVVTVDSSVCYDDMDTEEEVNQDLCLLPEDTCTFIPPLPDSEMPPLPPGEPPEYDTYVTTPSGSIDYEVKFYNAMNSIKNILSSDSMETKAKRLITKNINEIGEIFAKLIANNNKLNKEKNNYVDETFKSDEIKTAENDKLNFDESQNKVEETENIRQSKVDDNDMVTSHGWTKSVEFGTPVLKIHSPYRKLPSPDKFKKDISDVINFENLPNSTGKYKKLKSVLSNVRKKKYYIKESKMNVTI